jgi:drug/metabolite transporter (DMT)-like permease
MRLDATAVGVAMGIAGAAIYALITARRHKCFRAGTTATVFLGCFAPAAGIFLVKAGFSGDVRDLPTIWREYVAIAGVIGIGLAIEGTANAFRAALARPAKREDDSDQK